MRTTVIRNRGNAMLNSNLVLCIVLLVAAAGPAAQEKHRNNPPSVSSEAKPAPAPMAQGKAIYTRDCAICHGDDGKGQTDLAKSMQLVLDDWSNAGTLAGKTDKDLFDLIRAGKDKMPAEPEGRASDAALKETIEYIRTFSKTQNPSAAVPSQ